MKRTRSAEDASADPEKLKAVKRERLGETDQVNSVNGVKSTLETPVGRRVTRSKLHVLKSEVTGDNKDDLSKPGSNQFETYMGHLDEIQVSVQRPREQLADAEVLYEMVHILSDTLKSQSNGGLNPSDFVSGLIENYGHQSGSFLQNSQISINWKDIGLSVSHVFRICHGCRTMLGPMNTEVKQRKVMASRKRLRPTESVRPEEMKNTKEEKTDTDKNMATMFDILRKKKHVSLESLLLNRNSFAQTVENMFTLSFLVKDGRVEITVKEDGSHLVSPRNAPAPDRVMSGDVAYQHFVFRFDFKDWQLMQNLVPVGEELMPHRAKSDVLRSSMPSDSQAPCRTTPIKKLSRNRGMTVHEESVVEDTPETDDTSVMRTRAIRACKRKLNPEL